MLVQCYGTYSNGWRWRFTFDLSDASTRTIGALMLPRTFGLAAHHINNIIITSFASFLSIGSVSVYNFANNLQAVPTGLVAIPFALAVFPLLSEMDLPKDNQAFLEKIISTARYILFLIVPIIIILLLLRAQIVRLILGSGAFDWTATIAPAWSRATPPAPSPPSRAAGPVVPGWAPAPAAACETCPPCAP
jgi:putative peptidoglycan lipid II flippase